MIVATAGHIDHGKTLLVKRLTGIDTDRLPEEKRRGISIDRQILSRLSGEFAQGMARLAQHASGESARASGEECARSL